MQEKSAAPRLWVGIQATVIYATVVAVGMFWLYQFADAEYGSAETLSRFWFVELILSLVCIFYVSRYFTWSSVGFGRIRWRSMIWLLPSYMLIGFLFLDLVPAFLEGGVSDRQLRVMGWLAITTFLIGFSEEVMFRGILLRSALTSCRLWQAMLISAVAFSLLHAANGFGGQSMIATLQQLMFTFLVGFFLAPVALKIGNLWPLIIWHWLWDFVVLASDMMQLLQTAVLGGLLVQMLLGAALWVQVVRGHGLNR